MNCPEIVPLNRRPSPEVDPDWTKLAAAAFLTPRGLKMVQAAGPSAKARDNRSKARDNRSQARDNRSQAKVFHELAVLKGLRRNPNCFLLRFALTPPLWSAACPPMRSAGSQLASLPADQRQRRQSRSAAGSTPIEAKSILLSASGVRRKAAAATSRPRVAELQVAVRFEAASMPTSLSIPPPLRSDQTPLCHWVSNMSRTKRGYF